MCPIKWIYKCTFKNVELFCCWARELMDDRTVAGKKSPVRPPVAGHLSLSQAQQIIGRHLIELGKLDRMGDFGIFIVLPCVDCPAGHSHGSCKIGLGIAVRQAQVLQTF